MSNEIVNAIVSVGLPMAVLNPIVWLALGWVVYRGKSAQVGLATGAALSMITASALVRLPEEWVPEMLASRFSDVSQISTVFGCLVAGALFGLLVGGIGQAVRSLRQGRDGLPPSRL